MWEGLTISHGAEESKKKKWTENLCQTPSRLNFFPLLFHLFCQTGTQKKNIKCSHIDWTQHISQEPSINHYHIWYFLWLILLKGGHIFFIKLFLSTQETVWYNTTSFRINPDPQLFENIGLCAPTLSRKQPVHQICSDLKYSTWVII